MGNKIKKIDWERQKYLAIISLIQLALSIGLFSIGKYVPNLHFESGGFLNLSLIPLILNSLISGPIYGTLTGLLFALFNIILDTAFSFSWYVLIFDYILVSAMVGFCSFFRKTYYENKPRCFFFASLLYFILKMVCHIVSDLMVKVYTNDNSFNFNVFLSSNDYLNIFLYNLGYLVPSFILSVVIMFFLSYPLFMFNSHPIMRKVRYKKAKYDEEDMKLNLRKTGDVSNMNILVLNTLYASLLFIPMFLKNHSRFLGLGILSFLIISTMGIVAISLYKFMEDKISNNTLKNFSQLQLKIFNKSYKYDIFVCVYALVPLILSIIGFIRFAVYLS